MLGIFIVFLLVCMFYGFCGLCLNVQKMANKKEERVKIDETPTEAVARFFWLLKRELKK